MKNAGKLEVTTPSDREIAMTRVFDAPRRLVFDAFTRPELVRRWLLGPSGWTMPVCEIDLRVGGRYRYVWRKPGVPDMGMGGVFREIVTAERIVATESFDDTWYEGEALDTTVFDEQKGRTTVTMTMLLASKEIRDKILKSGKGASPKASDQVTVHYKGTFVDGTEFDSTYRQNKPLTLPVSRFTKGFAEALRTALRQDPDVVLVGEMRDLETIESALRIAETGHLTFATLHTNSAVSTINRIIDVFPSMQQAQVRAQLSLTLEGILCQTLLPKADGRGRALAMEILIPNSAIRNLIREDKVHQIYSMMQTGQDIHGMQTFNQSLATLFHKRLITRELAMQRTSNANELRDLIDRGAGLNTGNGSQARPPMPPAYAQPGRGLPRK